MKIFDYVVNLNFVESDNVDVYQVFINGDYYGNNISEIQINKGDILSITITKDDNTKDSSLQFSVSLI